MYMYEKLKNIIDYFSIAIGVISMIFSFFFHLQDFYQYLIYAVCGILGLYYIFYGCILWLFYRIDFDRHLIYGHFLRKVVCLVLLMPFTMTALMEVLLVLFPKSDIVCDLPKELFYDEKLYIDESSYNKEKELSTLSDGTGVIERNFDSYTDSLKIVSSQAEENNEYQTSNTYLKDEPTAFWTVFYHFIDPGNQHVTITNSGRGWAAFFAILGVFLLNGLLVSSIVGWIDIRKEQRLNGDIRYKLKDLGKYKFAVVIGANEIAASVIKNLLTPKKKGDINYKCESCNRYVILQTKRDVRDVREELSSHLNEKDLNKVVIYSAPRNSRSELQTLFTAYATEIYVLGESTLIGEGETFHDAMNMRCVNLIASILKDCKKNNADVFQKRVCKVMFDYQTTYSMFQFSGVSSDINKYLVFIPFNIYESWAHKVIIDGYSFADCLCDSQIDNMIRYMPLDGEGIKKDSFEHIHFVIVGMSKMGIAMGVQALHNAHYLNFANACKTGNDRVMDLVRTRITFIDTNADKEMELVKGHYDNLFNLMRYRFVDSNNCEDSELQFNSSSAWKDPMDDINCRWKHLGNDGKNFLDVELEFIKGNLESEGVRKYLNNISDNRKEGVNTSKLTVAICFTKTHQAVAASLYMPVSVYRKAQQIWVYQKESADIILNLFRTEQKDLRYKKLRPFGMSYGEYMSDRTLYLKAMLVNGVYKLSNTGNRNMSDKNTYIDLVDSWDNLSIDKKYSNKYFVDSIGVKIRGLVGCFDRIDILSENLQENEDLLALCEHNRWNVQQLLMGYYPCDKDIDFEFQTLEKKRKLKEPDSMEIFKERKAFYKEGEYRLHPNICSYEHLDAVDSEAKKYDKDLNNVIPTILKLMNNV